jgi:molecular chaperone DnaJ
VATGTRRDYYALLGVSRGADQETIRRAFRARAAECHPDVSDDPDALERFRALTEAYEVLSRPETRARYDRYGFETRGVGGFAGSRQRGSFGLFDDLLEFVAESSTRADRSVPDVHAEVDVEFLDAIHGVSQSVRFVAVAHCETCGGEGVPRGTRRISCPGCGGRGRVRTGGEGTGEPLRLSVCGECRGTGRKGARSCADCGGSGRVEAERRLLVRIPAGTADGQELRVPGEGHAGSQPGQAGDLLVRVRVLPAPDQPHLRRIAAGGALLALALLLFVLVH